MKCSVPQCTSGNEKVPNKCTFHKLPKDRILAAKWVKLLSLKVNSKNYKSIRICSAHFAAEDYYKATKIYLLRKGSIPMPQNLEDNNDNEEDDADEEIEMDYEEIHEEKNGMQDSGIAEVQSYCNVNYSLNMDDFNDGGGFLASTINHDHNYVQRHPAEKIDSMDVDPDVEMEIPEIPSINPETSKSREFYKNLAEFEKVSVNRALTSTPNLSQSTSPTKPYLWHKKLQVLREYIKPKKRAVKRLQTKCKRQSNSLMNAKEVIKELRQKNLLNEETMEKLDTLTEFQKELLNLTLNKKRSKQISPAMKKFALNLNYYGPQGYNYVRKELGQMLPHSSTIARWYKSVDSAPGFSSEALKAIQNAQEFANHQLFVHLSFDEMSIRKQSEWVGGKRYGHADFGNGDNREEELASEMLVFLVTCINAGWKIPLGYFPCHRPSGEQKANLLKMAITNLQETKVRLTGVTCDGAPTNLSALRILGCHWAYPSTKTTFTVSNNSQENLAFYPDPVHMIKLVRTAIAETGPFVNGKGEKIDWVFMQRLVELQEKEGLHAATKIRRAHIEFRRQKMKVRLAVQVLSRSVGIAIGYCNRELKMQEFQDSEATEEFTIIFNDIFDILNSHSLSGYGFKKALCFENIHEVAEYSEFASEYISTLTYPDGLKLIESPRKTGFLGILTCLKNLPFLYTLVVENSGLTYLPTYKLNQDHLEMFFGQCRSRYGSNNNPTVRQFIASYKRIATHCQIRDKGTGNCVPIENITILHTSQTKPTNIINSTNRSLTDDQENNVEAFEEFCALNMLEHILTLPELSPYSQKVTQYIGGFVTRSLQNALKCEECIESLEGSSNSNSLIWYKTLGYLKFPSKSVEKICVMTERVLRTYDIKDEKTFRKISNTVKHEMAQTNVFDFKNPAHTVQHRLLLIQAVCEKYLNTRYYYEHKKTKPTVSMRQYYTHMTLYMGQ